MTSITVRIHPVVLFNIVDIYQRRNSDANRVIGTLLGQQDKSGNVEISNSFVVQHREANNEVAIDIEVAKELYELHRKVNPNESIIGWFATGGGEINEYSVVIHDYYSRETTIPIHLTVDPSDRGINIKAYISTPFGVPGKTTGTMFSQLTDVHIAAGYEPEMIGLRACTLASNLAIFGKAQSMDSELDMIINTSQKAQEVIASILHFIDESILTGNKSIPSNSNDIGRQLMATIESIVPFGGEDDDSLNANLKDLLMVVYLTNLTKTQLVLNEKLSLLQIN
ncbi:eukaryotic translation initiation factor 3 subunit F-like [Oppia nitens]|uniref:eukaryotic translation initiation factor 3 subunit F-like n=1 Tax=Oppia nitens TaxID=1686743 RepID=UPI0023DA1C57|nr:eukaryotic translation initiation factor 3 subunit F-like [Oppia nitens]